MRTLYLPYEIHGREVFGHLHLTEALLLNGQVDQVVIGNKLILGKLMKLGLLVPGVWYLKSAQRYILGFLENLKSRGFKIVLHDAEAISTFDGYDGNDEVDMFMKPKECLDLCDLIFASTTAEQVGFVKYGQSDKVHLVGAVRFHHHLDRRFRKDIYDYKWKKNLLLITSGTSLRLHKLRSISENKTAMSQEGINDDHIDFLFDWARDSHLDLLSVVSVISDLIKFYGEDLRIVIRPHPSEDTQLYERLFEGFENVYIDHTTPLKHQVENADAVVVGSGSTTALESAIIGKQPITYLFDQHSAVSDFLSQHITGLVSKISTSPEELFYHIQQRLEGKDQAVNDADRLAKEHVHLTPENFRNACNIIGSMSSDIQTEAWRSKHIEILPISYKLFSALLMLVGRMPGMQNIRYALSKSDPIGCEDLEKLIPTLGMSVRNIGDSLFICRR